MASNTAAAGAPEVRAAAAPMAAQDSPVNIFREKEAELEDMVLEIIQSTVNPDEYSVDMEKEWIKSISKATIDYCKEHLGKYRYIVNTTFAKKSSGFSSYSICLFDPTADTCKRVVYDSESTKFQCIVYIYAISLN